MVALTDTAKNLGLILTQFQFNRMYRKHEFTAMWMIDILKHADIMYIINYVFLHSLTVKFEGAGYAT